LALKPGVIKVFLEICNSKSRGIWMLGQKGKLFHLNFPITMQSFGIFRLKKDVFFYFSSWIIQSQLESLNFQTPAYCGPVGSVRKF
jgi:hypothetical protein